MVRAHLIFRTQFLINHFNTCKQLYLPQRLLFTTWKAGPWDSCHSDPRNHLGPLGVRPNVCCKRMCRMLYQRFASTSTTLCSEKVDKTTIRIYIYIYIIKKNPEKSSVHIAKNNFSVQLCANIILPCKTHLSNQLRNMFGVSSSDPSWMTLQVAEKTWTCAALPLGGPGPSSHSEGCWGTSEPNVRSEFWRNIQSRWLFPSKTTKSTTKKPKKVKETWGFHL